MGFRYLVWYRSGFGKLYDMFGVIWFIVCVFLLGFVIFGIVLSVLYFLRLFLLFLEVYL